MFAWETIEKAIDTIEAHLFESVCAQQLADSVGLSVFYFQRLFKRLTGRSVMTYVKLRRLAVSCAMLDDADKSVLEVALACGFSSHASYTRAFHECFGMSPQTYRRERPVLNVQLRPELSLLYGSDAAELVTADNLVFEIELRSIAQPEFYQGIECCVPIVGQIPAGSATGVDLPGELWRRFHAQKAQLAQGVLGLVELGVCHSHSGAAFTYFAGAQAVQTTPSGENLADFILPPGEYAVCRIEAPTHEELVTKGLYSATQYMYDVYLPAAQRKPSSFAAEKYNLPDGDACCMALWIPLTPVTEHDVQI